MTVRSSCVVSKSMLTDVFSMRMDLKVERRRASLRATKCAHRTTRHQYPWGFSDPPDPTRKYPHPQHGYRYFEGTGTGSPGIPQGYPCQSLGSSGSIRERTQTYFISFCKADGSVGTGTRTLGINGFSLCPCGNFPFKCHPNFRWEFVREHLSENHSFCETLVRRCQSVRVRRERFSEKRGF
jgi:hypothetical protein